MTPKSITITEVLQKTDTSPYDIKFNIEYSIYVGTLDLILDISQLDHRYRRVLLNRAHSDMISVMKIDSICQYLMRSIPWMAATNYTIYWNNSEYLKSSYRYTNDWIRLVDPKATLVVHSIEYCMVNESWMALINIGT